MSIDTAAFAAQSDPDRNRHFRRRWGDPLPSDGETPPRPITPRERAESTWRTLAPVHAEAPR